MLHIEELDHIVLRVADVERAVRFYSDGLGLPTERLDAYRSGNAPFPSVRITPDTIIDLFPPNLGTDPNTAATTATRPNLDHVCLVCADPIETLQAHVAALGLPIETGPTRVFGARGTGTSIYIRDPDNTLIELRTYT
jgi:catechol 2,3-dioxygenase-like lactoylglutathione lyase family enzyme